MPFNLMDFITQIAQQNQQSAQTPPVQAPQPQQGAPMQPAPMQQPGVENVPGQNAMSGSSPFAQVMGASQGKQDDHKGLFSTLLKLFAGA